METKITLLIVYLATGICLITHLGGSSIATIIVLEESLDSVFVCVTVIPCTFFSNYIHWIIDYHGYMYSYNVCFRSSKNIRLLLHILAPLQ